MTLAFNATPPFKRLSIPWFVNQTGFQALTLGTTTSISLNFTSTFYPDFGGEFVGQIDGIPEAPLLSSSYWIFFVNGVESQIGISQVILQPDDTLEWVFGQWYYA